MISQQGEETVQPESTLLQDQQSRKNPSVSTALGQPSSIYSLTLDEFQHTLSENGKDFGSMNMDEFLTSIWTAEENQVAAATAPVGGATGTNSGCNDNDVSSKQPSLSRQGSLSLPAPLSRKTVDEVWSEIHSGQSNNGNESGGDGVNNSVQASQPNPRRPTFGEMTLEDFLVKAGVVREQEAPPPIPPHLSMYNNINTSNISNPMTGMGFVSCPVVSSCGGYQPPPLASYGGGAGNGGMYGASPVSTDVMVAGGDNDAAALAQFGMDVVGLRSRKRMNDAPVEKVVERRQRRMIKNRESAARSRARKQAYTVELEAELNQLKEENKQLKQALAELDRKRREQYVEDLQTKTPRPTQKPREKLRTMRRNTSCPM